MPFTPTLVPNHLAEIVDWAAKNLSNKPLDAIAFQGMSGALVAAPLSIRLNKPLILVRKPGDVRTVFGVASSLDYPPVEAEFERQTKSFAYVFVDDFSATGSTAKRVVKQMSVKFPKARLLGFYFYCGHTWLGRDNQRVVQLLKAINKE